MHQIHPETTTQDTFLQGVKDCIPTLLGYISIGVAFGVVGIASGISVLEIFLLSVLVYAGSAQFIFCGLYLAGAPVTAIIVTIFIVNLRHLLMSLTIAPYFIKHSTLRNIGFGTLLTDETFGVSVVSAAKEGRLGGKWMNGLNVTAYTTWITACTIGGVIGQWLPDPEKWGLDYALVAMFVALLVLTLASIPKEKLMHYVKLILWMVVFMYGFLYFMPGHLAVLISTLVVATIGVASEK